MTNDYDKRETSSWLITMIKKRNVFMTNGYDKRETSSWLITMIKEKRVHD